MTLDLDALNFDKGNGLVSAVIQDARSGQVLTVAFADRTALERTMQTGEVWLHSRSRGLWHKGETSGNTQTVVSLQADCDGDAVLVRVVPNGPACHNGTVSCFGNVTTSDVLSDLDAIIRRRAVAALPVESYTRALLNDRNKRLKKIGEEAAEVVLASADDDANDVVEEVSDLVYHLAVVLHSHGMALDDVRRVLHDRNCT